jgi:hypothetical protein
VPDKSAWASLDRLDDLNRQLLVTQRLTWIGLHIIDDDVRLSVLKALLEPELRRSAILINHLVRDLERPDLQPAIAPVETVD